MRIVHCFLILAALAILLKNVYSDSSNNPLAISNNNNKNKPLANAGIVKSYILAVTWPPGFCSGKPTVCHIKPVPADFSIHGLWPNNGKGKHLSLNLPPPKWPIQIASLTSDLNKNWPDLTQKQISTLLSAKNGKRKRVSTPPKKMKKKQLSVNENFWLYEWINHGQYSELGVQRYFQQTLELFTKVGGRLRAKLADEKITPTIQKTYKLQDIEAALKKINGGFSVTVVCNKRSTTKQETQIQEVRFKFTNDFQKQNNVASTTCGGATTDVMFPAAM